MHVLLVNYEYPGVTENCGGGGRVTELLREGLEERGCDVRVITDNAGSAGSPAIHGPTSGGHYATFPLRAYRHLDDALQWADVVNGHFSLPSSLPLARLATKHDVPFVCSVMGADVYDPTRFRRIRPIADAANRRVLGAADAVVAPSSDMAARVDDRYGIDTELIHYGLDVAPWEWRDRQRHDPPRVLTVARLVERKNWPRAGQAIYLAGGGEWDWRIVGDGPLRGRLERDFDEIATVCGYVDDLQSELEWADLFFLPSKHEAFGMVFLEALASGLPVVTSACGGQTDIVANQVGATAPPDDPEALADALRRVVDQYDWYQSNTEGYVKTQFDRKQMVDAYKQTYEALA